MASVRESYTGARPAPTIFVSSLRDHTYVVAGRCRHLATARHYRCSRVRGAFQPADHLVVADDPGVLVGDEAVLED